MDKISAGPSDAATPFLLVTGCPRSGTSLLANELMRHYDVAIPFETHFIPVFHFWRRLYGDLSQAANRARMLADIYLFSRLWIASSKTFSRAGIVRASILITEPHSRDIVAGSHDFASLVHCLFQSFAQLNGAAHYADKSAFFNPVSPEAFARALGPIRIVAVVRDGRDVFLSWQTTWFGTTNAVTAARTWRQHVAVINARTNNREDALILRYEDLISDPEKTLARAASFLGLFARPAPIEPDLVAGMATAPEHAQLKSPPSPRSTGRYRLEMPGWQQHLFQRLCGDVLTQHGYERSQAATGRPMRQFLEFILAPVAGLPTATGRWAKFLLPVVFLIGGRGLCRQYTRD